MDHTIVYRIDPELSCGFAPTQQFVAGDDPTGRVAVRPIQLEFDAGAKGCVVSHLAHDAAIPELVQAWQDAGMTGFEAREMVSVPNAVAADIDPGYRPPAYVELIITGGPEDDLHHALGEVEIRVSRRAAEIYSRFDPGEGALFAGTEHDVMGDSLPPGVEEAALRFEN